MDVQEIQVQIDTDGKVHLSLHGVKGESCLQITKELEALLGNQVEERKLSHEYYEPTQQQSSTSTTQITGK